MRFLAHRSYSLSLCLALLASGAAARGQEQGAVDPHAAHHHHHQGGQPAAEPPPGGGMSRPRAALTPEEKLVQGELWLELIRKSAPPLAIYEKYLPKLGAQPILDVLEDRNQFCHGEAHELGRAVYRATGEVGRAFDECGSRCTSGCLHGVLKEAFGSRQLDEVKAELPSICGSSRVSGPGTCAHGMGHALVVMAGKDIDRALAACGGFTEPVMAFFCQGGVFMELFDSVEEWTVERAADPLYPCSKYRGYPAACYRYLVPLLMAERAGDRGKVMDLCRTLERPQRLACFFGYGWANVPAVQKRPDFFAGICPTEPLEEATMCVEGAIEYLAVWDAAAAAKACARLQGEPAEVCKAAAREGFYRLQKPSLPLYLVQ